MQKIVSQQLQDCYLVFLRCGQTVARDFYKWVSYKKGFGCWWVMVGVGGYILAGGGWWWVVLDIFWLVVGAGGQWWIYFGWWSLMVDGGGYILAGGSWWWVLVDIFWLVVGGGRQWWVVAQFSLIHFISNLCTEFTLM